MEFASSISQLNSALSVRFLLARLLTLFVSGLRAPIGQLLPDEGASRPSPSTGNKTASGLPATSRLPVRSPRW
jgi:hypothetical protein